MIMMMNGGKKLTLTNEEVDDRDAAANSAMDAILNFIFVCDFFDFGKKNAAAFACRCLLFTTTR